MKAMISQPMGDKSEAEIRTTRAKAEEYLKGLGYEVIDTYFTFSDGYLRKKGVKNLPLHYLAVSIMEMATCDAVYFCHGWDQNRGCVIEREAAERYGVDILEEE